MVAVALRQMAWLFCSWKQVAWVPAASHAAVTDVPSSIASRPCQTTETHLITELHQPTSCHSLRGGCVKQRLPPLSIDSGRGGLHSGRAGLELACLEQGAPD